MRPVQLSRGTRHLALGAGPLTVVVVFSLWWLRRPWWLSRAGGTLLARLGPVELIWWSGRRPRC